jgi:peptidylprolyl isomerase
MIHFINHHPSSVYFSIGSGKKPWSKITELDDGFILTGKPIFFFGKNHGLRFSDFPLIQPMTKIWSISASQEGIAGMKTGGVRKLRIPGNLAFGEKALPSAPGRMALPPFQPVEAVVTLDFIPGAEPWALGNVVFSMGFLWVF